MNEFYYIIKFILWMNVTILLSLYYEWMYYIIKFILWMNVTILLTLYNEWLLLYYQVYIMNECYYIYN